MKEDAGLSISFVVKGEHRKGHHQMIIVVCLVVFLLLVVAVVLVVILVVVVCKVDVAIILSVDVHAVVVVDQVGESGEDSMGRDAGAAELEVDVGFEDVELYCYYWYEEDVVRVIIIMIIV